jgi:ketosteroid isomerase-like protein
MTDQSSESQIRAVLQGWAKAVRDVDMDGILAHHSDDIVMFDVPPPVQQRGREAYKKTWEQFFTYSSGGAGRSTFMSSGSQPVIASCSLMLCWMLPEAQRA